jgi:hypothetical protein
VAGQRDAGAILAVTTTRPDPSRTAVNKLAVLLVVILALGVLSADERLQTNLVVAPVLLLMAPAVVLFGRGARLGLMFVLPLGVLVASAGLLTGTPQTLPWALLLIPVVLYTALDARRYLHFAKIRCRARAIRSRALETGEIERSARDLMIEPHALTTATQRVGDGAWLGWTLAMLACWVMWKYLELPEQNKVLVTMLAAAVMAAVLGGAAKSAFRPNPLVQSARDYVAQAFGEAIMEPGLDLQLAYAVYLRPFVVTGVLRDRGETASLIVPPVLPQYHARRIVELETPLGDATWALGIPLLGLGKPGEAFGAGRLAGAEAEWQQTVASLIARAKLVLVIPSDHRGTLWELSYLMEHQVVDRCMFIMPWAVKSRYSVQDWRATAAACKEVGIELPEYVPQGALFVRNGAGGWAVQPRLKRLIRRKLWLELGVLDLLEQVQRVAP